MICWMTPGYHYPPDLAALRPGALARGADALAVARAALRGALDRLPGVADLRGGAADPLSPAADAPDELPEPARRTRGCCACSSITRAPRPPTSCAGSARRCRSRRRSSARTRRREAAHLGARPLGPGVAGADLGRPQRGAELDVRSDHPRDRARAPRRALRRQADRRDRARRAGRRDDGRVRLRVAAGDVRARARGGAREHAALQARAPSPTAVEHSLIGRIGQHMLRRAIQLVRGARHGGMILVVDGRRRRPSRRSPACASSTASTRTSRRAATGRCCSRSWSAWPRRRRSRRSAGPTSRATPAPTWSSWSRRCSSGAASSPTWPPSTARWSSTSGSGCSASAPRCRARLPSPLRVWRALDTEGTQRELDDIEDVGTRHRAAYRFVHDHPRGPGDRHLARRRRLVRRQPRRRGRLLGAVGQSMTRPPLSRIRSARAIAHDVVVAEPRRTGARQIRPAP